MNYTIERVGLETIFISIINEIVNGEITWIKATPTMVAEWDQTYENIVLD